MSADTIAPPIAGTVHIPGWLCNGSINPLIRHYLQLKVIAGANLSQAICYASVEMECYFHEGKAFTQEQIEQMTDAEKAAVFYAWQQRKRAPAWKRRKPILQDGSYEPRTAAQLLARHGNLECRAKCEDIEDLCASLRFTHSYNDFDASEVASAFERFNLERYYENANPNAGRDIFTYFYGWEGSSVIYIQSRFTYRILALSQDWKRWTELTKSTFGSLVQTLAERTKADECDCREDGELWRLWWD